MSSNQKKNRINQLKEFIAQNKESLSKAEKGSEVFKEISNDIVIFEKELAELEATKATKIKVKALVPLSGIYLLPFHKGHVFELDSDNPQLNELLDNNHVKKVKD